MAIIALGSLYIYNISLAYLIYKPWKMSNQPWELGNLSEVWPWSRDHRRACRLYECNACVCSCLYVDLFRDIWTTNGMHEFDLFANLIMHACACISCACMHVKASLPSWHQLPRAPWSSHHVPGSKRLMLYSANQHAWCTYACRSHACMVHTCCNKRQQVAKHV